MGAELRGRGRIGGAGSCQPPLGRDGPPCPPRRARWDAPAAGAAAESGRSAFKFPLHPSDASAGSFPRRLSASPAPSSRLRGVLLIMLGEMRALECPNNRPQRT